MDYKDVLKDFRRARQYKSNWLDEAKEDFEYVVGKQWDASDKEELRSKGVKALTINKIQPNLMLLSGIQRQNRTEYKAFPEGEEDSIKADITTRLLRNAKKRAEGDHKSSEQFEDGCICGEGWIQPYIDYTDDLLNGELHFKKVSPLNVFPDPDSTEYDLSDAEYIVKFTPKLTERQVAQLFPDKESKIKKLGNTKVEWDKWFQGDVLQVEDYPDANESSSGDFELTEEKTYDLIEYEYKKYVTKWLVANKLDGTYKEVKDKQRAEEYKEQVLEKLARDSFKNQGFDINFISDEQIQETIEQIKEENDPVAIIKRVEPEIWVKELIGANEIDEHKSNYYPKWKRFSLIPFFAHKISVPIKDQEYMVQGIVRSLKDLQDEVNKRRTQELRIVNQSANSGWIYQRGAWVRKGDVKKFGSSPGVMLEYKKGFDEPRRIDPPRPDRAHQDLAMEATAEMRETSGINAELLSQQADDLSGRAIHLRQQQGLVMIQRILDNFARTKMILAKFILSQLGELYTVERAVKVVGEAFIQENLSKPVMQQGAQGEAVPVMEAGEMKMQVNKEEVYALFNQILNDTEMGKYDVTVGEGQNTATARYANYLSLLELSKQGVPIPPDVLIDESDLSESSKKKITNAYESQKRAQQQEQQQEQPKKAERSTGKT